MKPNTIPIKKTSTVKAEQKSTAKKTVAEKTVVEKPVRKRRGRKPKTETVAKTKAVIRLYEVTLRDGTSSYISGESMLLALGVDSVKDWDVLKVKEMGTLYS